MKHGRDDHMMEDRMQHMGKPPSARAHPGASMGGQARGKMAKDMPRRAPRGRRKGE